MGKIETKTKNCQEPQKIASNPSQKQNVLKIRYEIKLKSNFLKTETKTTIRFAPYY